MVESVLISLHCYRVLYNGLKTIPRTGKPFPDYLALVRADNSKQFGFVFRS